MKFLLRSQFVGIYIIAFMVLSNCVAYATSMQTIFFTGTINSYKEHSVESPNVIFEVGDTFFGYMSFVYNPLLAPVNGTNNVYSAEYSFHISFNNFLLEAEDIHQYLFLNTNEPDEVEFYSMGGPLYEDLFIGFTSSTGDVLASTGLSPSIDTTKLDAGWLSILFAFPEVDSPTSLGGQFDTVSVSTMVVPVPEPSTIFLCSVGLVGFAFGGTCIKRTKKSNLM